MHIVLSGIILHTADDLQCQHAFRKEPNTMDTQELTNSTPEQCPLSPAEIKSIKSILRQPRRLPKDWDCIKSLLGSRSLFTVHPADEALFRRFTIDGVLYDQDVLLAFTDPEDCEEYGRRYAAVRIGREFTIVTVPYEEIIRIAEQYEKDVYIDLRKEFEERFLVYDGKRKTLHLCINQGV